MSVRAWIFCAALLPLPAMADVPADFSGEWVLSNSQAGDKAASTEAKPADAHSGSAGHGGRGGMGGRAGGGMGGGGHHGRHSQSAAGGNAGTNPTATGNPRLHASALIIRQSEVVFDIAANVRQPQQLWRALRWHRHADLVDAGDGLRNPSGWGRQHRGALSAVNRWQAADLAYPRTTPGRGYCSRNHARIRAQCRRHVGSSGNAAALDRADGILPSPDSVHKFVDQRCDQE